MRQSTKFRNRWQWAALIVSAVLLPLIASGCRYTAAPADLLNKPAISSEKQLLLAAVNRILPKYSTLMLPHKDDYKEAIRLIDIDGDGKPEAVVTYYNEYSTPEILVLKETENGWRQWANMEQPLARGIAWLKFADLDADGTLELLVGWVGAYDSPHMLELYAFQSATFRNDKGKLLLKPMAELPYNEAEIGDLNNDGIIDIAVISSTGSSGEHAVATHELTVYNWRNGGLMKRSSVPLYDGVNAYERLTMGQVSENHTGIVAEANTGAHSMFTFMYTWENGSLKQVFPDRTRLEDGFSGKPTKSEDMNEDGIIELQLAKEAPGNGDQPYSESYWIYEWLQWDGQAGIVKIGEQYRDYTYGLQLDIPQPWLGRYTLGKPEESDARYGLVSFRYWEPQTSTAAELAVLLVVPQGQWSAAESAWKESGKKVRLLASDSGNAYAISHAQAAPPELDEANAAIFAEMLKAEEQLASSLKIVHEDGR